VLQWLSDSILRLGLADIVSNSACIWPVAEILHFVGMAFLIGTVGTVDLRILGLGKGLSIATLEKFIPFGVAGFVLNAATGFVFLAGNPAGGPMWYFDNLSFRIKMVIVGIAGLNLLAFYATGIARALGKLAPDATAPLNAKVVAGVSLVAWFAVILFGRLIMYNEALLYTLGL
jgi:hypothetical protein